MKNSTGVILVLIIVILLGVIGVGCAFYVREKDNSSRIIAELKNEVENLKENEVTNTTTSTQNTTSATTQSVRTMKDVAGKYEGTYKDDSGYDFSTNLYLDEDGTFGCFFEVGGITGSYSIDGNKIILNVIFSHGGGTGLRLVSEKKTLVIINDESLETKDIGNASETTVFKKESDSTSDFNIRENIKGSIGTGPDYDFSYNY